MWVKKAGPALWSFSGQKALSRTWAGASGTIDNMPSRVVVAFAFILLFPLGQMLNHGSDAWAKRASKGPKLLFLPSEFESPQSPELKERLPGAYSKAIADREQLAGELPAGAPAYNPKEKGLAGNKELRNFLKRAGLRPYSVRIQVLEFAEKIVPNPQKPGKLIKVELSLRMFGTTIPEQVMAFTGEGSASLAIEVGNKIRERDRKYALDEVLKIALAQAIDGSLEKLKSKYKRGQARKGRRKAQ